MRNDKSYLRHANFVVPYLVDSQLLETLSRSALAMYQLVLFWLAIAMSPPKLFSGQVHASIKNGFYKIINPTDGLVLTATQNGRPELRHVITEEWKSLPTQKWKVKTVGGGLQIIRNEQIKDNEMSKEIEEEEPAPAGSASEEGKSKKYRHIEWNLVKQEDGSYEVNNGFGCLHIDGKGSRVSIDEDCDTPHKWQFLFLQGIQK